MTTTQPPRPRLITSRSHELTPGFAIRRALPTREQRMIGAWCFLDHIGPVEFNTGNGMHVGAHPHIGLQTFTWLVEGQIRHRDSLGYNQIIRPGQVNLMTAGKGVSHTEDSLPDETRLHGAQLWITLPKSMETIAPAFQHYTRLPEWRAGGLHYTLLAGRFRGQVSPVAVHSPLLGIDITAPNSAATATLPLNPQFEHGIMVLEGEVRANDTVIKPGKLAYWQAGAQALTLRVQPRARILFIGGEPFAQPVKMWWNFVGSSPAQLRQAVQDWNQSRPRFGVVPGQNHRRLISPAYPN